MLVIVFGVLAVIFCIITIVLIVYICRSRRKNKHSKMIYVSELEVEKTPQSGEGMERQKMGSYNLSPDLSHFTTLDTIPEMPFDPHYAEIGFGPSNGEVISLSSQTESQSSTDNYADVTKQLNVPVLPSTKTGKEENSKASENQNLLDPDTGVIPLESYDI